MKLKQWETALEDIDKALADHDPRRHRHDKDRPCAAMVEMQTLRALILEELGRTTEARAARKLAAPGPAPYRNTIYSDFHMKLKELREK